MASITVEVTNDVWAWSDPKKPVVLRGGTHELTNPPAGLVKAIAAAEAAQAGVRIVKADAGLRKHAKAAVEPDRVSLKHQAQALKIRHELLADRDTALLSHPASDHPEILETFEQTVDEVTRARLGEGR